jgi:hypothetical protein
LITDKGYTTISCEKPRAGSYYYLVDADEYTPKMRGLIEPLIREAYKSGRYNWDTIDLNDFREEMKLRYGEGYNECVYYDPQTRRQVTCKSAGDLPEWVLLEYQEGNKGILKWITKSTTDYTKRQFSDFIDAVINSMFEHKVDTPKFWDIIEEIYKIKAEDDAT